MVQIIFFPEQHCYGTLALVVSTSMFISQLFSILFYFVLLSFGGEEEVGKRKEEKRGVLTLGSHVTRQALSTAMVVLVSLF